MSDDAQSRAMRELTLHHVAGAERPPWAAYDADVVILALDRAEETVAAIRSALSQTGVSRYVIVVDQGSSPDALACLAAAVRGRMDATLVTLGRNHGVPGGRNIGAGLWATGGSSSAWTTTRNSRRPDTLARMAAGFDADPDLAALGCRIVVHATGEDDLSSWGYPAALLPSSQETFEAATFVGAGHAIRREAWNDTGGYDARLFFCWEEYDFCLRAIARFWRVRYRGDIVIRHKVSAERRVTWSGDRWFHFVRNRHLYRPEKRPVLVGPDAAHRRILHQGGSQWLSARDAARGVGGVSRWPEACRKRHSPRSRATTCTGSIPPGAADWLSRLRREVLASAAWTRPEIGSGDRSVDPGDQVGRQSAGLGRGDALRQFLTVLHAQYQRVDRQRQRVTMRQHRRVFTQFGAQRAEPGGAGIVQHFRMIRRQRPVDRGGQRAGLHRADAHHGDAVGMRRRHDLARPRRIVEEFQPAGRVQQIGDDLNRRRFRVLPSTVRIASGWPIPVMPQAPIRPSATNFSNSGRMVS